MSDHDAVFFATVGVIVRLGARPVFVDIDPVTYNLDPARLEAAISPRKGSSCLSTCTSVCRYDPILETHTTRVGVVEDAAQAIGSVSSWPTGRQYGCRRVSLIFPSKNLGGLETAAWS
jgi:dTDP-4-amino-4,6-dideoxygalactose transaminase